MATYTVKLRKDGALNLPVRLRKMYDFRSGSTFSIEVTDEGIKYTPRHMSCPICGEEMKTGIQLRVLDSQICKSCDKELTGILTQKKCRTLSDAIKELSKQKNRKGSVKVR